MPSKQEDKIKVSSPSELHAHFDSLRQALAEPETEDTWARLDKALAKLEAITKGGAYKFDEYVGLVKDKAISGPICNSLLSERTRISGTAADLLNSVAPRLADRFEPLITTFVPSLLVICGRTNKVALKRAQKTLSLICTYCKLPSALLPYFRDALKEKVITLRIAATEATLILLQVMESDRDGERLRRRGVADNVETIIKQSATDASSDVRGRSKALFQTYMERYPERIEAFTTPLTPTTRRYLALPKKGAVKAPSSAPIAFPSSAPSIAAVKSVPAPREQNDVFGPTAHHSSSTRDAFRSSAQSTSRPASQQQQAYSMYTNSAYPHHSRVNSTSSGGTGSVDHGLSRSTSEHHAVSTSSSARLFMFPNVASASSSSSIHKISGSASMMNVAAAAGGSGSSSSMSSSAYRQKDSSLNQWAQAFSAAISSTGGTGTQKRERTMSTSAVRVPLPPSSTHAHDRQGSGDDYRHASRTGLGSGQAQMPPSVSAGAINTRPKEPRPATAHPLSVSVGPTGTGWTASSTHSAEVAPINSAPYETPANLVPHDGHEPPKSAPSEGAAARLAAEKEAFERARLEQQHKEQEARAAAAKAAAATAQALAASLSEAAPAARGGEDLPSTPRDVRVRRAPMTAGRTGTAKKANYFKASRVQIPAQTPSHLHQSQPEETKVCVDTAPEVVDVAAQEQKVDSQPPTAPVSVTPVMNAENASSTTPAATPADKIAQSLAAMQNARTNGSEQADTPQVKATAQEARAGPASQSQTRPGSISAAQPAKAKSFKPNTANIVQMRKATSAAATVRPKVTPKTQTSVARPPISNSSTSGSTGRAATTNAAGKAASSTTMRAKAPLAASKASNGKTAAAAPRQALLSQKKIVRKEQAAPASKISASQPAAKATTSIATNAPKIAPRKVGGVPSFAQPTSASVKRQAAASTNTAAGQAKATSAPRPAGSRQTTPAATTAPARKGVPAKKPAGKSTAPATQQEAAQNVKAAPAVKPSKEEPLKDAEIAVPPAVISAEPSPTKTEESTSEPVETVLITEGEQEHAEAPQEEAHQDEQEQVSGEEEILPNAQAHDEQEEEIAKDEASHVPTPGPEPVLEEQEMQESAPEPEGPSFTVEEACDGQVPMDEAKAEEPSDVEEAGTEEHQEPYNAEETAADEEQEQESDHEDVEERETPQPEASADVDQPAETESPSTPQQQQQQQQQQGASLEPSPAEVSGSPSVEEPRREERETSEPLSEQLADCNQTADDIFDESMPSFAKGPPATSPSKAQHKRISILAGTSDPKGSPARLANASALSPVNLNTRSPRASMSKTTTLKPTSPKKPASPVVVKAEPSPKRMTRSRSALIAKEIAPASSPDRLSSDGHVMLENTQGDIQLVCGARDTSFFDDEENCAEDDTIILQPGVSVR